MPLGFRFRYVPQGALPRPAALRTDALAQYDGATSGFWMAETEVTQSQWHTLMGNNPSEFLNCGDDCPVERVSWYDAVAFANRLSTEAGKTSCYEVSGGNGRRPGEGLVYRSVRWVDACDGYRLPTETEWEHADRAGNLVPVYRSNLEATAWFAWNSGKTTHPVGTKAANSWGLHDTAGNVYEWLWDAGPLPTADGPGAVTKRMYLGGSWLSGAEGLRAVHRGRRDPGARDEYVGFRLASGPAPAESQNRE